MRGEAEKPALGGIVPSVRAIPLDAHPFRSQDGGGAALRPRSVFETAVRGSGAPMREIPLLGASHRVGNVPNRVLARPFLGQEGAAAGEGRIPLKEVERIISRELPSAGLSKGEASLIGKALASAIVLSRQAIADGEVCIGVDEASLSDAREVSDFLSEFAETAGAQEKTGERLSYDDLALADRVIACGSMYERIQSERRTRNTALIVSGVLLGTIVLIVAT